MFFISIYLFLLISIIQSDIKLYPSILTLLNQRLILVANEGIHFYDSNLENEETEKLIPLNITTNEENYKTALAQFSEDNDGYILILVKNIIYIFQPDGKFIFSLDLSDYLDGSYYCITPYKKIDNNLHYIISYSNLVNNIILDYFIFDLSSHSNSHQKLIFDVLVQSENRVPTQIVGTTCLFLLNSIYDEVLTCFYGLKYPFEIHARSFDPNNNFNEFTDIFKYVSYDTNIFQSSPPFLSAITNFNRTEAFICFIHQKHYWLTFDFYSHFSSYTMNEGDYTLLGYYPINDLF